MGRANSSASEPESFYLSRLELWGVFGKTICCMGFPHLKGTLGGSRAQRAVLPYGLSPCFCFVLFARTAVLLKGELN